MPDRTSMEPLEYGAKSQDHSDITTEADDGKVAVF